jgi:hypothetical protein
MIREQKNLHFFDDPHKKVCCSHKFELLLLPCIYAMWEEVSIYRISFGKVDVYARMNRAQDPKKVMTRDGIWQNVLGSSCRVRIKVDFRNVSGIRNDLCPFQSAANFLLIKINPWWWNANNTALKFLQFLAAAVIWGQITTFKCSINEMIQQLGET